MSAEERWDTRHMAAVDEDPEPSPTLVGLDGLDGELPRAGRALDLACGRGRNAVWLAARGLHVDAVDVSSIGLARAASLAARRGVADRVRTVARDLETGLPPLAASYDAVVCLHFRAPALWPLLAPLVAPGGLLVIEVLARDASNLDVNPEFLGEPGELSGAARGLEILSEGKALLGRRAVDRLVARRPAAPARGPR